MKIQQSKAITKDAVKIFTQGLCMEVGTRGITDNNIQPGPIDTDLNPAAGDWAAPRKANTALKRYGTVDDIAALVAFVAGPKASFHYRRKPDGGRWDQRLIIYRIEQRCGHEYDCSSETHAMWATCVVKITAKNYTCIERSQCERSINGV